MLTRGGRRVLSTKAQVDVASYAGKSLPVLIIGAGPVGLTLSALLRQLSVPSLVVERARRLTTHPQAHFINTRTMEIFRTLNGLEPQLQAAAAPLDQWRNFVYCTSATGTHIATDDHFAEAIPNVSPTAVTHFAQNKLLPMLLERAGATAFGAECVGVDNASSGVTAQIRDRGTGLTHSLSARFVVAADGASSAVAQQFQVGSVSPEGAPQGQRIVNVHFKLQPCEGLRALQVIGCLLTGCAQAMSVAVRETVHSSITKADSETERRTPQK